MDEININSKYCDELLHLNNDIETMFYLEKINLKYKSSINKNLSIDEYLKHKYLFEFFLCLNKIKLHNHQILTIIKYLENFNIFYYYEIDEKHLLIIKNSEPRHLEILNLNELNNNIENVRLFKIDIDDVFSRICIFYLIKCIDLKNLEKTKNDMIEIFQKFIVSIKK